MTDDLALIQQARAGNRASLDLLIGRYYPLVWRMVVRTIHDRATAEDITQNTFMSFCQALDQIREQESIGPYVRMIALNEMRDWMRQRKRTGATVALAQEPTAAPVEVAATSIPAEVLHAAITALPPTLREVVELKHLRQYTFRQIAEELGISPNTAMSRMRYGLQRLAALLKTAQKEVGG